MRLVVPVVAVWFALAALGACAMPQPQSQRVNDAARDLNLATRFGRMDVAAQLAATGARQSFLERRAAWGKGVRVLDIELAGLRMKDGHNATVEVDVQWVRDDDDTLRVTRIEQTWSDVDGPWQLQREKRVSGELGLLGEPVKLRPVERRDRHFETKTIR